MLPDILYNIYLPIILRNLALKLENRKKHATTLSHTWIGVVSGNNTQCYVTPLIVVYYTDTETETDYWTILLYVGGDWLIE
jgi:hypothetical protein